ncbi:hypothetical protein KGM_212264 [Danaus plexippus plexippus]|uniref:Uncharacterized protein n=1 Tax=Danaus plexippus plexippus TaxID=278856 RepID=A0A212F4A9_DANPL|nr:hypothetical protein KGM_212264 [Danaus plexippus plexippus]
MSHTKTLVDCRVLRPAASVNVNLLRSSRCPAPTPAPTS